MIKIMMMTMILMRSEMYKILKIICIFIIMPLFVFLTVSPMSVLAVGVSDNYASGYSYSEGDMLYNIRSSDVDLGYIAVTKSSDYTETYSLTKAEYEALKEKYDNGDNFASMSAEMVYGEIKNLRISTYPSIDEGIIATAHRVDYLDSIPSQVTWHLRTVDGKTYYTYYSDTLGEWCLANKDLYDKWNDADEEYFMTKNDSMDFPEEGNGYAYLIFDIDDTFHGETIAYDIMGARDGAVTKYTVNAPNYSAKMELPAGDYYINKVYLFSTPNYPVSTNAAGLKITVEDGKTTKVPIRFTSVIDSASIAPVTEEQLAVSDNVPAEISDYISMSENALIFDEESPLPVSSDSVSINLPDQSKEEKNAHPQLLLILLIAAIVVLAAYRIITDIMKKRA